ncbi:MAG: pyridoxal-phosphate dependent enzyme [Acidobacteria bacterium]|nr:pyridoxal-phosphate dependent enzyme [Acidobacteriota bacterium]
MSVPGRAISLEAVREAASRVYRVAVRTPVIRLDPIDHSAPEIFLKLEIFQPIGSFKLRGAANAIARLSPAALAEGVWTVSAGNAAQGVALAAREAGARASVLVMDTAPATKIANIERLGATIHRASHEECWKAVEDHRSARMTGTFVHPFDDDDFICGNGTAALEMLEDVPDVDAVIAAIGGGGLLSGVGCVMRALRPSAKVYAAEPETAAPLAASLAAGHPVRFDAWTPSFVDGAGGRSVLPSMWPLLREAVDASVVVSLADITRAMRLAAERCHIIAEGAGACAIAAALSPQVRAAGHKKIVVVVSGGNIDLARFASLVTE